MDKLKFTSKGCGESRIKMAKENVSIAKHYPWLESFDKEAKTCLSAPEMTVNHVLKLLTLMESNVSPEVSKLKTRPNRATKFLTQIRKKISLIKMGGLMIESELEKELFPTYGLLLVHIVNISLASSKTERLGADKTATELYYFLKLMFQGDSEYVLDVALCSNLDEHANSTKKVGFQLFSFIVEDWRLYWETQSSQMKYCAICSLLAEACKDGQQMVDQYMPNENMDKQFLSFLSLQMDLEYKKFKGSIRELMKFFKPITVKSISRGRLVVVSRRDIAGRRDHSESSDSSSATANTPATTTSFSNNLKEISSSSGYDPMQTILGELGLGGNFFLDTVGCVDDTLNKSYYDEIITDDVMDQNDQVSSSTRPKEPRNLETKDIDMDNFEKNNDSEESDEKNDDAHANNIKKKRFTYSSPERYNLPSSNSFTVETPSHGVTPCYEDTERWNFQAFYLDGEKEAAGYDQEVNDGKQRTSSEPDVSSQKSDAEGNADSDLEVLSVIGSGEERDSASMCSDGSRSRDEAEAESGEDVVPNYDVDSDVEENLNQESLSDITAVRTLGDNNLATSSTQENQLNLEGNIIATRAENYNVDNTTVQTECIDEAVVNITEKLFDSPVLKSGNDEPTESSLGKPTRLRRKFTRNSAKNSKSIKSSSKNIDLTLENEPTTRGRKNVVSSNKLTVSVAVRRSSRLNKNDS